jgi:hypothetical protein
LKNELSWSCIWPFVYFMLHPALYIHMKRKRPENTQNRVMLYISY